MRDEPLVDIEINGRIRGIDESIFPLVKALNDAGITTVASCSGHGQRPGNIALADGRELIIARNYDEARAVGSAFPGINGEPARALAEARAEGAREERERLAKLASETGAEFAAWVVRDRKPDSDGHRSQPENMKLADWLRSQSTGEG